MIGDIFSLFLYNPLYNALILFIETVPYADVGIAVILLTILVKVILFPVSMQAVKTQMAMKRLEQPLKDLKEKYKNSREELARKTMALYKAEGINPFASILIILIQLPIIFALYWVFFRGGLPVVNMDILYSFIPIPEVVNMQFIGLVDMGGKSIILALLAGITQYFQARYMMPKLEPRKENASMKDDLARSMNIQMRYVLPIIVVVISYTISAAIALYWTTSNLFTILQELYMRKKVKKPLEEEMYKSQG